MYTVKLYSRGASSCDSTEAFGCLVFFFWVPCKKSLKVLGALPLIPLGHFAGPHHARMFSHNSSPMDLSFILECWQLCVRKVAVESTPLLLPCKAVVSAMFARIINAGLLMVGRNSSKQFYYLCIMRLIMLHLIGTCKNVQLQKHILEFFVNFTFILHCRSIMVSHFRWS
jgi:hypothetical protein